MKERPILFSAPMVRAILEGRKTQTRRIVKHKQHGVFTGWLFSHLYTKPEGVLQIALKMAGLTFSFPCPYGQVGDRLWVRETIWSPVGRNSMGLGQIGIVYDADDLTNIDLCGRKKIPSIYMPRWASRITLEITDVRVERLRDISGADAVAEGCSALPDNGIAQGRFQDLWQIINGPESWAANPWVWVVSFRKV